MPSRILFAAAELAPEAKVGGLADVASALPKALARRGHDVTVVVPAYPALGHGPSVAAARVAVAGHEHDVAFEALGRRDGYALLGVRSDAHFARRTVYGHDDDEERFLVFTHAVARLAAELAPDVVHLNDWHTAAVAALPGALPTVLTIHNLAYQGPLPARLCGLGVAGVPARPSLLTHGIATAGALTTVSRRYAAEILEPEHGAGLDGLLRARRAVLRGILNGVDGDQFDPRRDPHVAAAFDASALERRALNKAALQRRSGLAVRPDAPLVGMVARLVEQKGVDLVAGAVDELVDLGAQLVVMGCGDSAHRAALAAARERRPDAVALDATDADAASRLVYAGSDLFLAPSAFEPCGLGPLIALRYGALPVVRRTGGLAETIRDADREGGLGFTFTDRSPEALLGALRRALAAHAEPARFAGLQRRAMATDFSWDRAAAEYEAVYAGLRRAAPAAA